MEPLLGMIAMFGFGFPPRGWALCNGQIMAIAQNQALFALLGTYYGGNGQTNFALPDLRGKIPIGFGSNPGFSNYVMGQTGGSSTSTLTINQMPMHNHTMAAASEAGDTASPEGAFLANTGSYDKEYKTAPAVNSKKNMHASMMANTGNNQPFNIMQPYLVINYSIALVGIFPSRN
jgi:microcystin-dependent protein